MPRVREHIERITDLSLVAFIHQDPDIAALSLDAAGDIDDFFRLHFGEYVEKRSGAAGARRVDEGGVDRNTLRLQLSDIIL